MWRPQRDFDHRKAERAIGMLQLKTKHLGRVQPENLKCKCGETGKVSLEVVCEECGESWLLL